MFENFRSALRCSAVFAVFLAASTLVAAPGSAQDNQPKQPEVKATHGDWDIACVEETCWMQQLHKEGDIVLLSMVIEKRDEPLVLQGESFSTFMTVSVPTNVWLTAGLRMRIDERDMVALPYERCNARRCVVVWPLNDDNLTIMREGGAIHFVILLDEQRSLKADISLSGFTAAFDGL